MKAKEVEALRKMEHRADRPHGSTDGNTVVLHMSVDQHKEVDLALASVPRLLDEREALIRQLTTARYWLAAEVVPVKSVRDRVLDDIDGALSLSES